MHWLRGLTILMTTAELNSLNGKESKDLRFGIEHHPRIPALLPTSQRKTRLTFMHHTAEARVAYGPPELAIALFFLSGREYCISSQTRAHMERRMRWSCQRPILVRGQICFFFFLLPAQARIHPCTRGAGLPGRHPVSGCIASNRGVLRQL